MKMGSGEQSYKLTVRSSPLCSKGARGVGPLGTDRQLTTDDSTKESSPMRRFANFAPLFLAATIILFAFGQRELAAIAFIAYLASAVAQPRYSLGLLMAGPFFMDAGKAIVTNLVSGLGGTVPKYVAIGTGAGPAASTATALTTEVETR